MTNERSGNSSTFKRDAAKEQSERKEIPPIETEENEYPKAAPKIKNELTIQKEISSKALPLVILADSILSPRDNTIRDKNEIFTKERKMNNSTRSKNNQQF